MAVPTDLSSARVFTPTIFEEWSTGYVYNNTKYNTVEANISIDSELHVILFVHIVQEPVLARTSFGISVNTLSFGSSARAVAIS